MYSVVKCFRRTTLYNVYLTLRLNLDHIKKTIGPWDYLHPQTVDLGPNLNSVTRYVYQRSLLTFPVTAIYEK